MDGVLVDFEKVVIPHFGITKEQLSKRPTNEWSYTKWLPESFVANMWEVLKSKEGEKLWESMPKTPECDEILISLKSIKNVELCILSSTAGGGHRGKYDWLEKHAPYFTENNKWCFTPEKHKLANPNSLLLDDHIENCKKFRDNKGEAILIPRYWNPLHRVEPQLIPILKESLKLYGL